MFFDKICKISILLITLVFICSFVLATDSFNLSYDKNSVTLFYGKDIPTSFSLAFKNDSNFSSVINFVVLGDAGKYFINEKSIEIIQPHTVKNVRFMFLVNDDSLKSTGTLKMSSDSEVVSLPLELIYDSSQNNSDRITGFFLSPVNIFGNGIPLWVLLCGVLGVFAFFSNNKKTQLFLFLGIVAVVLFVFGFSILNAFGVGL